MFRKCDIENARAGHHGQWHLGRSNKANLRLQRGFLMPLSLFILVGLGALAIAISRMGAGQFSTAVQESLSVQAFYAAESGAQLGMHRILFNTTTKSAADLNCTGVNGQTLNFSVTGLSDCSTRLQCTLISNVGESAGIYRVQSTATCGSGNLTAERRVITAVRYE